MKTKFFLLAALLLTVCSLSFSQKLRVDDVYIAGSTFANSAGDSDVTAPSAAQYIPLAYNGMNYSMIQGLFPDSIRVTLVTSADSAKAKVYFKGRHVASGVTSRDSIANLSAASGSAGFISVPVTASYYTGKDQIGLAYSAQSTGNAGLSANKAKVYLRIERYFTVPKITK